MTNLNDPTERVLLDVASERQRQAEKGYTREHDAEHDVYHLWMQADRFLRGTDLAGSFARTDRASLVKAAACLVAAIEQIDLAPVPSVSRETPC